MTRVRGVATAVLTRSVADGWLMPAAGAGHKSLRTTTVGVYMKAQANFAHRIRVTFGRQS